MLMPIAAAFWCERVGVVLVPDLDRPVERLQERGRELLLGLGAGHPTDGDAVDLHAFGDQVLLALVVEVGAGDDADAEEQQERGDDDQTSTHGAPQW